MIELALSEIPAKLREAVGLHRQGLLAEAETLYSLILERQPDHVDALHLCGVIAAQTNHPERAIRLIGKALELDPAIAAAHNNLAGAYEKLRRFDEALASYGRAISIKPDYVEAHFNRANLLTEVRRLDAALDSYDRATALKPEFAQAHCNRGIVLRDLRRYQDALASFERAIAIDPRDPAAFCNRGAVLFDLGHLDAALASYDRAIALDANYADAHNNRGAAFLALRQIDAALNSLSCAIALQADHADAHFNKAYAQLLRGDMAEGWREHEWRWKSKWSSSFRERREFSCPLWSGDESLVGNTILLHGEQGLGDTLMFCRYATIVAARGARIVLEVQQPLLKLLSGLEGVSQVLARGSPLPRIDYHCPLMSLPLAFKTTMETIPCDTPYLDSDTTLSKQWRKRLSPDNLPLIGLAWSGSPTNRNDQYRSIPLKELIEYLPTQYRYVVLQKDVRERDAVTLRSNPQIISCLSEESDFTDAAALCACTDLVISVDTSLAHLSGALGKKTWILLAFNADWRWLMDRNDTPWYPTATLYRQSRLGDWRSVFETVKSDLLSAYAMQYLCNKLNSP